MSPEQAKGRDADKRSDIWAFGAVLYEMLTGRRAFDGEDVSDTLASVLKSDPDWSRLSADVPPAVGTLIRRCLVKDRRERLSEIATAKFVLSEWGNLIESGAARRGFGCTSRVSWFPATVGAPCCGDGAHRRCRRRGCVGSALDSSPTGGRAVLDRAGWWSLLRDAFSGRRRLSRRNEAGVFRQPANLRPLD